MRLWSLHTANLQNLEAGNSWERAAIVSHAWPSGCIIILRALILQPAIHSELENGVKNMQIS